MGNARLMFLLAGLIALTAITGCMSSKSAVKLKPAEESGWKLAFTDTFDRDELGDDWKVIDGNWKIVDGNLRGSGTLIMNKGFPEGNPPGFQRFEFEAATDVKPIVFFKNKGKPKVTVSDISSFIQAQPPEKGKPLRSGYFFQFGGFNNSKNQIRKQGTTLKSDDNPEKVIDVGKSHKIIVENDEGKVRMFVDGELVLEQDEKTSVIGPDQNRAGFYFYTACKVPEVKVYVKKLPDGLDMDLD